LTIGKIKHSNNNSTSIAKKIHTTRPQKVKFQNEDEPPTEENKHVKERRMHPSNSSPSLINPKTIPDTEEARSESAGSSPARRRKPRDMMGLERTDRVARTTHSSTPIKSEKIKKAREKEGSDGDSGGLKVKSLGRGNERSKSKDTKEEESKKSKERRKRLDEFKQKLKKREENQRNSNDGSEEREDDKKDDEKRKKLSQAAQQWKNRKKEECAQKKREEEESKQQRDQQQQIQQLERRVQTTT